MKQTDFTLGGKLFQGWVVDLPKAPLVLASGQNGFVMCGYLNVEAANKLAVAAAVVSGVATVDDLLKGQVKAVSVEAQKKGVTIGMSGEEALQLLN